MPVVVARTAAGSTLKSTVEELGISQQAVHHRLKTDSRFASKYAAAKLRARGDTDGLEFVSFREAFFGHSSPEHHLEMVAAVESQGPDTVSLVLAPPESAKTTLTVDWINYRLAKDPNWRICVISESRDLSRKILAQVQDRMTDDTGFADYINTFGPFKAPTRDERKGWNSDYFHVMGASHDEKEPSMEARGAGSRLYGARYDKEHLDDIQSLETLNKTRSLLDSIRQTYFSRLAHGKGSMSLWGSRVGSGDVYAALLEENVVDREHFVRIPALTRPLKAEDHFELDRHGKVRLAPNCPDISYWPGYWTMLDLARKRHKVGERIWQQTYMQEGVSSEGASFPLVLVQACLDRQYRNGNTSQGIDLFCSLDPALTGPAAFGVWAYDQERLWLVHMETHANMGNNENIFRKVSELSARFRPTCWVIEQDGSNKGLVNDDRLAELATAHQFLVRRHQTSGSKSSMNFGVAAMATSFARREIVLPYAGEDDRRMVDPLVAELTAWRGDVPTRLLTQDRVMCSWFAWRYWMDQRKILDASDEPEWTPSWAKSASAPSWLRGVA